MTHPIRSLQPLWLFFLSCALLLSACRALARQNNQPPATTLPLAATPVLETTVSEPSITPLQFKPGRNDYIINVEDTPRELIVYVPSGYDPNQPTPVVVMCHGSNQTGQVMYENTHWVAKAEQANLIVAFPTSWKYPLVGEKGLHEKWNSRELAALVPPDTPLKDDVQFIRTVVANLQATFNVDPHRIFATGFSNGGGFVLTRLIPQMSEVFAAFGTGGSGLLGEAVISDVSIRFDTSLYSVLGTNDEKIAENQGLPTPFPFAAEDIVNDPHFGGMLQKTTTLLNLDMAYTAETATNYTRFTFNHSQSGVDHEYVFMMIRNMGHVYPSGDNNRAGIDVADLFWEFFRRHAKPD